jgi:DNA repair protein RadA/Sms
MSSNSVRRSSSAPTKAAPRPAFRCAECGWSTGKWVGRCGECQAWGTVSELGAPRTRTTVAGPVSAPACAIQDVDVTLARSNPTGVGEFDRVLGGGLVPGAVVLVAGEPGIGKSTLLLDVAARAAREGRRVLYVTGEESAAQVRLRAERIEAMARTLFLAAETDLAAVLGHIDTVQPELVVVDSVQTIASADLEGAAGNVAQTREVAAALIAVAKERNISTLLVGHVTKDGSIAGPRVLEHLVDVVIAFEGERHSRLRLVRAVKNRYGPTDEVGCFDLSDAGLVGLPDPSGLFLSRRAAAVPGTCLTVTLEGRRPLIAEVQGLVTVAAQGNPRRASSGIDSGRLSMILAVLDRRAQISALRTSDVHVATIGGVRLTEPASDLAVALAIASATIDRALVVGTVAIGEVGLAGEVRPVAGIGRRLVEAYRLGFSHAIAPPGTLGTAGLPDGMRIAEAPDIGTALRLASMRVL